MKDAETDPETIAAWAAREPQRGFIECADKLQDRGHSVDALADAMLTVSLMMMHRTHGPQWRGPVDPAGGQVPRRGRPEPPRQRGGPGR